MEDLPDEAQRYRYRLVIQRGLRNAQIQEGNNNRKREREVAGILDEAASRLPKRRLPPADNNVIELSSDPDEPNAGHVHVGQHTRGGSGRQISPVSVSSTDDESDPGNPFEELDDEVFEVEVPDSEEDDDLVDTSLDEDEVEITGEKSGSAAQENTTDMLPESSGTRDKSKDKGKGNAVEEPILDLQEELECFICCSPSSLYLLTVSINSTSTPHLLTMWSRRVWTLQYSPLSVKIDHSLPMAHPI